MKTMTEVCFGLLLMLASLSPSSAQTQNLPAPQLKFAGTEDYEANGQQWTKYKLVIVNRSDYGNDLFTPAPDLPLCSDNKNSSRTWVNIYNGQSRQRIYYFCALKAAKDLGYLWFAIAKDTPAPASVYVTITDRRTNNKAGSNVVAVSSAGLSTISTGPTGELPSPSPMSTAVGAPDLIVTEIVFDQPPSKIRVRFLNQGNVASSSCHLALQSMVGDDPSLGTKQRVWTIEVPAMEAGKGFSKEIDVSPLTQSNGPWKATVDRSNAVAESNENNNTLTYPGRNSGPFPPNWRGPDLVIDHFELIDPVHGNVKVQVSNKGAANSNPCTFRLIVWEPGKFEHKEAKTVFVKVQALHAGQTTTVAAVAGVPIINTKYSMYVDISEEVKESDENNNRAEGDAGNFKP
jgi:hypothetical protein